MCATCPFIFEAESPVLFRNILHHVAKKKVHHTRIRVQAENIYMLCYVFNLLLKNFVLLTVMTSACCVLRWKKSEKGSNGGERSFGLVCQLCVMDH